MAFNVGGGALFWLNRWLGLRVDLRYFHAFVPGDRDEGVYDEDYDFGRLAVEVSIGLPR